MAKTTKKLKDHHRAFLVREFACFSAPQEAAEALRQEYGIEITPQSAQHYDATSGAGRNAAKKWRELFDVCRKAFLDDIEKRVPEAYKEVRIQELAKAARSFKKSKNYIGMANMLERVAKEVGGAYTNRFERTGKAGGPIQYQPVEQMSDAELDAEICSHGIDPADIQPGTSTRH